MAKIIKNELPKKGGKGNKLKDILLKDERSLTIKEATIVDGFCNYTVEIIKGTGIGDHNIKGAGLIKDDLADAFADFNVHLAVIDEVFKHANIEIKDIDKMISHELTSLYRVTSFKIKGGKDNESIILKGIKHVSSSGGFMEIVAPKIALDNLSSYHWYNELKAASDTARREVELYMNGKFTPVKEEEPEEDANQQKLPFDASSAAGGKELDDEFKDAKVHNIKSGGKK